MLRVIRIAYYVSMTYVLAYSDSAPMMLTMTSQLESYSVFTQNYLGVQANFHGRGYRISLFLAQTLPKGSDHDSPSAKPVGRVAGYARTVEEL